MNVWKFIFRGNVKHMYKQKSEWKKLFYKEVFRDLDMFAKKKCRNIMNTFD